MYCKQSFPGRTLGGKLLVLVVTSDSVIGRSRHRKSLALAEVSLDIQQ